MPTLEHPLPLSIAPAKRSLHSSPAQPLVEVDERAARRSLREQIARLEAQLGRLVAGDGDGERPLRAAIASPARPAAGAHLLSLERLEQGRDELLGRVRDAQRVGAWRADAHAANRLLLEEMMRDPAKHRFVRVSREDLGESGCGGWEVRPRLGVIGMLAGWWHVVVSSGCPLAT